MDKFLRSEQTPEGRLGVECFKKTLRNKHSRSRHWLTDSGELEIVGTCEGEVPANRFERAVLLLEVLCSIRGIGFARLAAFGAFLHNPHQLLRIAKWQRAQQNCVHHAEDGNVGADSKCEDENRNDGEAAVAAEGAQGVADVSKGVGPVVSQAAVHIFSYALAHALDGENV